VNSTGSLPGSGQACVWYTQDETASFTAAYNAAHVANSLSPSNSVGFTTGYGSFVACPAGGYVLSGPILNEQEPSANSMGVGFSGFPGHGCVIYISPLYSTTVPTGACGGTQSGLVYSCQVQSVDVSNFLVDGVGNSTVGTGSYTAGTGLIKFQNVPRLELHGVQVWNWGYSTASPGCFYLQSVGGIVEENVCEDAPTNDQSTAIVATAVQSVTFTNNLWGNHNLSKVVSGSGARNTTGGGVLFVNDFDDECISPPCTQLTSGTVAAMIGGVVLSGLSEDGTSSAYISDMNIGAFGSVSGNLPAITLVAGSFLSSQGSTLRGNGTTAAGAAVIGPATATFVDEGSNSIQNCLNGTCANVTTAQYPTLGFSGGIIPKSSLTHTPNTCYDVTSPAILASTVLCNQLLDQNYQLLNIAVSSTTTTACATAPNVTLSDGTNTATITLTSGASTWSSTGLSTVFKAGNTFVVTYDTNAGVCATPPTNLAVSYVLQSVLNN
jgi:hypothetical protein